MSPCLDWLIVKNSIFCQAVPQPAADFAVRVFQEPLCVHPLLHHGFCVTLVYGLAWGTDLLWQTQSLGFNTSPSPLGQGQVKQKSPRAELGPAHTS